VLHRDPNKPKAKGYEHGRTEETEEAEETVKLVDGSRDVDQPLTYFTRGHLQKGEYLLFYRAAFRDPVYATAAGGVGGTGDDEFMADPRSKKDLQTAKQMDASFNSKHSAVRAKR
jgi:hypothetical protein